VTWVIGYVRASPFAACNEIADEELLVTAPVKVDPSLRVTVACCPAAGAEVLLQPQRERAITLTIRILTVNSSSRKLNSWGG
jgi:hypothetical protein